MALSQLEITNILESKRFTCSNINEYKNLDTVLHLTCNNGHHIDASLRTVRNANFRCPYCAGNDSISDKLSGIEPPQKNGFRIIALDNATENAGVSIFDDGRLVFYHLLHFEGDTIGRIMQNKNVIKDIIIKQ